MLPEDDDKDTQDWLNILAGQPVPDAKPEIKQEAETVREVLLLRANPQPLESRRLNDVLAKLKAEGFSIEDVDPSQPKSPTGEGNIVPMPPNKEKAIPIPSPQKKTTRTFWPFNFASLAVSILAVSIAVVIVSIPIIPIFPSIFSPTMSEKGGGSSSPPTENRAQKVAQQFAQEISQKFTQDIEAQAFQETGHWKIKILVSPKASSEKIGEIETYLTQKGTTLTEEYKELLRSHKPLILNVE